MLGLLVGLLRRAVAAFMVLFIFFPCGRYRQQNDGTKSG